jgi:predicted permease
MSELRHAIRSILRGPAFAITAILTIALGIGANTAVYAVVHAVLLDPLPFRQPERLVQAWESHPELHNLQVSMPDYFDWKKSIKSLDFAAYTFQAINKGTLSGQGEPIAVQATNAEADLFPLLGIEPLVGHLYSGPDENTKRPVVLISEHLWRTKFSSDPKVTGRPIRLDGTSFTIVGVLPLKMAFPVWADVWMPLSRADPAMVSTRKYHPLEVIGRLHPGVSIQQAEIEAEKIAGQLSVAFPATNGKIGVFIVPIMETIVGDVRPALIAVWAAVGLVLLIACANLAHLMMSRALNRRREIAIRLAIGANKLAAFRIFLVETLILSGAGAALGVATAYLMLPVVLRLAQGQIPRLNAVEVNLPVLLFGFVAALLVAMLFALPSYLQVFRADLNETLSSASARISARESRLSAVLMSSELALSLAVVLAAIGLVRSLSFALETDPGFQADHTLALETPLVNGDGQKSYELFQNRIAPEIESISGVQKVAAVNSVPMSLGPTEHTRFATRFGIVGRQFEPGQFPVTQTRWSTPDYFGILRIPLVRGRLLSAADYNQPRVLINQTFARRFFPNINPVGQKLLLGVVSPHPLANEIMGVVGDVREFGLTAPPEPVMYSINVSPEMNILVKTASNDPAVRSAVAKTMRRINPQQAIGQVKALSGYLAESLARQRFVLTLMASFAGLAMCLCAVGIYGVFSYSLMRRMREFGIRTAVGARRIDLLGQVGSECMRVIIPGLIAGLGISAACTRFMRALLYKVSPIDVESVIAAAILILLLCLAGVIRPAWRAAKVEPADILREQ